MADDPNTADEAADDGWRWMLVEIFGHREHAGRCREEERLGVKMLRIDEPLAIFPPDGPAVKWTTHWYPGAAIFSLRQTTEELVMRRAGVKAPPAIVDLTPREGWADEATKADEKCPECGGPKRLNGDPCDREFCPTLPF